MLIVLAAAAGIILFVYLLLIYYPAFGGRMPDEQRSQLKLPNFVNGKFVNTLHTPMEMGMKGTLSLLRDYIRGNPNGRPQNALSVLPAGSAGEVPPGAAHLTWFGHSSVWLQTHELNILIDPMLGNSPSPFTFLGGKRYSSRLPIDVEELPPIDAVLISHDHYDHLDYGSIRKLKDKVGHFFVPLGVASHLIRWGVPPERISEHAWWDELQFQGLTLACTPARHFSGRSLGRNTTLWCSWVIASADARLFFSGDSGYGPHFAEIGERYGPFDLTMMECGQYDERWPNIHMMPEETVQAQLDVRGRCLMPIHWGAFTLALHDWTDPVERVSAEAARRAVVCTTPQIGETVVVGASAYPASIWWK